tara:strand:+ start:76 stop:441 length:366 start_codon:yes stop_codon:yes gene_type:complete
MTVLTKRLPYYFSAYKINNYMKKVTEKWVKQQVVKTLKSLGAYYFYPVANGYMSVGIPDIVACYQGVFIGVECKANGNTPTVLQQKNLEAITKNGGLAFIIDEHNYNHLEGYIWDNIPAKK